jgi:hypothetical protein
VLLKLARSVAQIRKKPPAPSVRSRAEARWSPRYALKLLADCRDGCTEALMSAHGYSPAALADLVGAGLAAVHVERWRAGAEWLEVRRFQITEAGRQALGKE